MEKILLLLAMLFAISGNIAAQEKDNGKRLVLITLDGYRWQELFGGADQHLLNSEKYDSDISTMKSRFLRGSVEKNRKALMPFIWTYAVKKGVMIGNRWKNSKMQVANKMNFSYPGYNEDLTGYPDDERVNSNDKVYNPNINVLEYINQTPQYKDQVLCFASWDVFPYILNDKRSGLKVNAGYCHSLSANPTAKELQYDREQDTMPHHWKDVRPDKYTFGYALEAMKTVKPKVVYVAFGETDDYAHEGDYDEYLKSAYATDDYIRQLWEYCQLDPFYKGKTTFIITCDHGRGDENIKAGSWCDHWTEVAGSEQTWLIAFGRDIPSKGEVKNGKTYYNKQLANTVAYYLCVDFHSPNETGKAINFKKDI